MMSKSKKTPKLSSTPEPKQKTTKLSEIIISSMDKDVAARVVLSGVSLDYAHLLKIFTAACDEMYFRTLVRAFKNPESEKFESKEEIMDELTKNGFKYCIYHDSWLIN
jgi:hypothetical protein